MDNIVLWSEMIEFLNGYVLIDIIFNENYIIGINSQNEKFQLAQKSSIRWNAIYGKS